MAEIPVAQGSMLQVAENTGRSDPPKGAENSISMRKNQAIFIAVVLVLSGRAPALEHHEKGYQYLSPVPEAEYVSPQTRFVLVRFETISPYDLINLSTFIEVTGDKSGFHPGQTRIATDERTLIFDVSSSFSKNETVTVTLTPMTNRQDREVVEPFQYRFSISRSADSLSVRTAGDASVQILNYVPTQANAATSAGDAVFMAAATGPMVMQNGVSVPSDFPHIDVTINEEPDPGYIFLNNRGNGTPYNIIFDNDGNPIWYLRTPDRRRDFKVQANGWLTMLIRGGYGGGLGFIALDRHYDHVKTFQATNGYSTDEHELVVLKDGGYLLIGLRNETVDMRRYVFGGKSDASVRETVIQEFTAADELIFQWRAWDNLDIRNNTLDSPTGQSIRFPHMNAIDIDTDGHILLSSRHQSEVTKIHRQTGAVIWRLGGANSDFTFVDDPLNGFHNQHAIRSAGEGRYLIFDNGNGHRPAVSRAVEYELDTDNMAATLAWEFRDTPDRFSHYMANAQRLPNGNTLINWAVRQSPKLTEVRPDGTKAFEMDWALEDECYRVWRHPWDGYALKPYLIAESHADNVTLIFNQFGDPNVTYYQVYGGTSPQPTEVLAISETTLLRLTDLSDEPICYFRVTSVDANGVESDFSNEEQVEVLSYRAPRPGHNMVENGDFSQGKDAWTWELQGGSANWTIEDGVCHIAITDGGDQIYSVQLRQNGMPLLQGRRYRFEFDAWAASSRFIEAKVGQDQGPWINYGRIGYTAISMRKTRHSYVFTMMDPTDTNARVVINVGASETDVYVDNVSLFWTGG